MKLDDQVETWERQIRQRQKKLAIEPFEMISQLDSETILNLIQNEPGVVQTFLLLHLEPMKSAQVLLHTQEALRLLLLARIEQAQSIPNQLSNKFEVAVERKMNLILSGESNSENSPSILEWVEGLDRCFCIS